MSTSPMKFTNPILIVIPTEKTSYDTTQPTITDQPIGSKSITVDYYYLSNENGGSVTAISDLTNVSAKMHVRGDSTAGLSKKQYSVHLQGTPSDNGHFLGMPHGGNHWVFNDAGAVDKTMIRNPLAFNLQTQLGQWAPRFKYFEMYLCPYGTSISSLSDLETIIYNNYWGVYLNLERIRVESHRINIPNYNEDQPSVDVGFIAQINPGDNKYYALEATGAPYPGVSSNNCNIYNPKKEDFEGASTKTEKNAYEGMQNWYHTANPQNGWGNNFVKIQANMPDASSTWQKIEASTDYNSFAIYWLLNEICNDPDGYAKSTFFYKSGDKVYGGPLWDKNKSFGNESSRPASGNWNYQYVPVVWFAELLKSQDYCKIIWDFWTNNRKNNGLLTADNMNKFIDTQIAYLTSTGALTRNNEQWSVNENEYDSAVKILKDFISDRLTWIDNNLGSLLASQSGFAVPKN